MLLAADFENLHLSEPNNPHIHTEDPKVLLDTKVHPANVDDLGQFVDSTQFDIEKPEIYTRVIQGPNATEWAKAIKEGLDQLRKNNTWVLVPRSEIEPGHYPLRGK